MIKINYSIEDKNWLKYIEKKSIARFFKNIFNKTIDILKIYIPKGKTIEVSVVFTNDENIQKLNREFRKIDKATNVLSFPIYNNINNFLDSIKLENYIGIGDIVLSLQTLQKESLEQNKTFENHMVHLVVHSMLHLFGYDHIEEVEADNMEKLEIEILKILGIENPYL